jgi:hypothetical protein
MGTGENKLKYGRKVREGRRRTMKSNAAWTMTSWEIDPPRLLGCFASSQGPGPSKVAESGSKQGGQWH